ncbi:hypothetical protein EKE94_10690 [Mesobaculum littorinae]|uniref:Integrase catalytic domain-containing protein n=1 Tax=Mesobaculum littorinae TaxID=2486419 RepID=A0A438AGU6_9RHOB|nr:Mu transposase C-terminal domain-containing protein [Mesobaculum littorinae]RVV97929.1 hypothetical protein EKE94_10690 [Mesobaculum littorinae]
MFETSIAVYRSLIAGGFATKPGNEQTLDFMPDEDALVRQRMALFVIKRETELRNSGLSAKLAAKTVKEELDSSEKYSRVAPKVLTPRTIQIWKKKKAQGGANALVPATQNSGNRGSRYDATYEKIAWDVLEELYLSNDRLSLGKLSANIEKKYRAKCAQEGIEPGDCGKRSLAAVLKALPADDVIKGRHDSATARKLRLQAQFYHKIEAPFDLIEIDSTTGDIMVVNEERVCIGRPTICLAVDAAMGFPVSIQLSLEAPKEALTIRALKDTMTERSDAFFEKFGIENRLRVSACALMVHSDQGPENSGPELSRIVEALGIEWAKNTPGCPDRKPFVERMMREVNEFLHTLPGATTSKDLPNRQRIDKAMLEATLTLDELEAALMKWAYDVYGKKLRRGIHSPLRHAESPTQCWERLECHVLNVKTPEEIRSVFCTRTVERTLQRYGIEVEGVQFNDKEGQLRRFISHVGVGAKLEVRYDPQDAREIAVVHKVEGFSNPLIVSAKMQGMPAISFAEARRLRQVNEEAKAEDLDARSTAIELALETQRKADSLGRGKLSNLKKAKAKEAERRKKVEAFEKSKVPPRSEISAVARANQPTPKLPITRRSNRPGMDLME